MGDPMTPDHERIRPDELLSQLGWVRALARNLVADPDVTDDVLQQVCLLALQRTPRDAREGPRLRAWLAAVTRTLARHAYRSDVRRARREEAAALPEGLPSTIDVAAHREALRRLVDALTLLEEPYYSVVIARYFDGRPVSEIASLSGTSNAAVRQQLSRARQKLRQRLQSLSAGDLQGGVLAAIPLAHFRASLASASAKPALAHFGGLLVAKSVPVAGAVAAVIVITGTILFLASDDPTDAEAPVADRQARTEPDHAPSALPDMVPNEGPAAVPLEDAQSIVEADRQAPGPTIDRLALPAVPASQVWDELFTAADDLVFGTVTTEGLIGLSVDLLAQLPEDATPSVSNGFATYDMLEAPGLGRVQLVVQLEAPESGPADGQPAAAYTIKASLDTRPGAYTGSAADNSTSTNLEIGFGSGEDPAFHYLSALCQNVVPGSPDLWTMMNGEARAVAIGGAFRSTSESSTWRQITVQASGSADKPGFLHTTAEPVERPGRSADPRMQLVHDALAKRRAAVPR